jgi:hypothetical protein
MTTVSASAGQSSRPFLGCLAHCIDRHKRQIQEILTTQDGQHALAICTDGGVLYYHHTDSCPLSDISEESSNGSLVELQSLMREIDVGPQCMTDGAWALKRVGQRGAVVLVRACRNVAKTKEGDDDEVCRGSLVEISPLSGLPPPPHSLWSHSCPRIGA